MLWMYSESILVNSLETRMRPVEPNHDSPSRRSVYVPDEPGHPQLSGAWAVQYRVYMASADKSASEDTTWYLRRRPSGVWIKVRNGAMGFDVMEQTRRAARSCLGSTPFSPPFDVRTMTLNKQNGQCNILLAAAVATLRRQGPPTRCH